jgi:hypothetical protein
MTPVFLEPKPMPYLQHLAGSHNNNNDDHSGRNISPISHETLEDSKSQLAANGSLHTSQFYHQEHEKYGLQ